MTPAESSTAVVQWGDVGTWVGSISVAVSLFLLTLSNLGQRRETSRQIELQRSAQARLVGAWVEFVLSSGGDPLIQMTTTNASDLAVRNVKGYLLDNNQKLLAAYYPMTVLPPGTKESFVSAKDMPQVVELVLAFEDDFGVRWRKYAGDPLREIKKGESDMGYLTLD